MPIKSPFYEAPQFPPTGSASVDNALETWRQEFSAGYTRNLFELERIPFTVTTNLTNQINLSSVTNTTLLGHSVGLQGNEQINVFMFADLAANLLTTGDNNQVTVWLRVTEPGGRVVDLSSVFMRLQVDQLEFTGSSEAFFRITCGNVWRVEARIQTGGLHHFEMVGSKNAVGQGSVLNRTMIIQAF